MAAAEVADAGVALATDGSAAAAEKIDFFSGGGKFRWIARLI